MQKKDLVDKLVSDIKYKFTFDTLYPFATENINAYIDNFNLLDKSLLTVGSSGDQMINAITLGCKNITSIDICPLTEMYYYLKMASLIGLDRKNYINFLSRLSVFPFNKRYFNEIKEILKALNFDSYELWDYIFNSLSKSEIYRLLRTDINFYDPDIILFNRYLSNDELYEQAKKDVLNTAISFVEDDIISFDLNSTFDNIWLSNVGQYMETEFVSLVEKMTKILNSNGKMLLFYSYFEENLPQFEQLLIKYDYEKIIIPNTGATDYKQHKALIYKKKS